MIIEEKVKTIANMLRKAAIAKSTVTYGQLYQCFEKDASKIDVFDTLEAASCTLANLNCAIYTAVMAKKDNGLPGDGFYDAFYCVRCTEWKAILGDGPNSIPLISTEKRKQMVDLERARVYAHATANKGNP